MHGAPHAERGYIPGRLCRSRPECGGLGRRRRLIEFDGSRGRSSRCNSSRQPGFRSPPSVFSFHLNLPYACSCAFTPVPIPRLLLPFYEPLFCGWVIFCLGKCCVLLQARWVPHFFGAAPHFLEPRRIRRQLAQIGDGVPFVKIEDDGPGMSLLAETENGQHIIVSMPCRFTAGRHGQTYSGCRSADRPSAPFLIWLLHLPVRGTALSGKFQAGLSLRQASQFRFSLFSIKASPILSQNLYSQSLPPPGSFFGHARQTSARQTSARQTSAQFGVQ